MKKILGLVLMLMISFFSFAKEKDSNFFSVKLGDSRERVITKLNNAGYKIYLSNEEEVWFYANNIDSNMNSSGPIPAFNCFVFDHIQTKFKSDKLVFIQFQLDYFDIFFKGEKIWNEANLVRTEKFFKEIIENKPEKTTAFPDFIFYKEILNDKNLPLIWYIGKDYELLCFYRDKDWNHYLILGYFD